MKHDLITRLRAGTGGGKHWMDLHEEAADGLERLQFQNDRLRTDWCIETETVQRMKGELEQLRAELKEANDALTPAYLSGKYDGRKAERERCAQMCEKRADSLISGSAIARQCAKDIRGMGEE